MDAPPIADGTVNVHQRCIEDSDCMSGRCAGPTGDPGCYSAYTYTGARRTEHGGPPLSEGVDEWDIAVELNLLLCESLINLFLIYLL